MSLTLKVMQDPHNKRDGNVAKYEKESYRTCFLLPSSSSFLRGKKTLNSFFFGGVVQRWQGAGPEMLL